MIKESFISVSLLLTTLFGFGQSLIISEIHYNPSDAGAILSDDLEFIEITNTSNASINLTGYSFISGISFVFGSNSNIPSGVSYILAKNKSVFDTYTGKSAFGQYTGSLRNSGETIKFTDAILNTISEFTYSDLSPWPVLADGFGYSLELVNPSDPNNPTSWVASQQIGGSPGSYTIQSSLIYPIKVNEILANTSGLNPDKIELRNYSNEAVNISYWYITDDKKTPLKYQIPNNTIIPANGYKVFSSDEFGTVFSLSSKGEEVYIFSANSEGLTGYSHGFEFSVSDVDQSFGVHYTSENNAILFNQTSPTFGSQNSAPKVGPLVITDIMYNPDILTDEFLIIKNISTSTVSSNSPTLPDSNGIKITGIDYKFDYTNPQSFAPGESIIFTQISPNDFRQKYKINSEIKIFQYFKSLSNSNEIIEIKVPIYRDTLANGSYDNHYKTIDEVHYYDSSPWSTDADGNGAYLRRTNNSVYANDPSLWMPVTYPVLNTNALTSKEKLTLYPTIVENTISIESTNTYLSYKIIDDLGNTVSSGEYVSSLNVSNLETGMYFLVLSNNEIAHSSKFIKQ